MFTANEEIKEGKFSSKTNILTQDGFRADYFFHILRVSQSD